MDNKTIMDSSSVPLLLEVSLTEGKSVCFEMIEYHDNKFLLASKGLYEQLVQVLGIWLEENKKVGDSEYKNWLNQKKYNFYEGFNDSLSELNIKNHERESEFDMSNSLLNQTLFKTKLDFDKFDLDGNMTTIDTTATANIINFSKDESPFPELSQNDIKKKKKKRRTRKDRKLKEET